MDLLAYLAESHPFHPQIVLNAEIQQVCDYRQRWWLLQITES